LGIKDIRKMNINLLSKWWWKLETEDGLWQSIVKAKYMQGNNLIATIKHKADDSLIHPYGLIFSKSDNSTLKGGL